MEESNNRNNVYKKAGIIGAGKAGCSLGMLSFRTTKCWCFPAIIVYINPVPKKLPKEPEAYAMLP